MSETKRKRDPLKDLQNAYRKVFSSPTGRAVLADLVGFTSMTRTIGDGDYETPVTNEKMRELEGRRQVGFRIMQMLKVDIEEFYNVQIEQNEDPFGLSED